MEWRPSGWGQRLTRSAHWLLRLEGEYVEIRMGGKHYRQHVDDDALVRIIPGLFWARVELQTEDHHTVSVDGLPNRQASQLSAAVQQVLFTCTTRGRKALFEDILAQIYCWLAEADALTDRASADRRWITHEQQQALLAERPALLLQPSELQQLFLNDAVHQVGRVCGAEWAARGVPVVL
ncbi:MAG: helicase [Stenotrophomonas indicatrix]|jgi:DNA helicase-4|nr:helicase [Stenotrophomonas indicatrix]